MKTYQDIISNLNKAYSEAWTYMMTYPSNVPSIVKRIDEIYDGAHQILDAVNGIRANAQ